MGSDYILHPRLARRYQRTIYLAMAISTIHKNYETFHQGKGFMRRCNKFESFTFQAVSEVNIKLSGTRTIYGECGWKYLEKSKVYRQTRNMDYIYFDEPRTNGNATYNYVFARMRECG